MLNDLKGDQLLAVRDVLNIVKPNMEKYKNYMKAYIEGWESRALEADINDGDDKGEDEAEASIGNRLSPSNAPVYRE